MHASGGLLGRSATVTDSPGGTGHGQDTGAIELFKAGYSLEKITEMGNWSDPKMVFRYIRGYLASEKAMVSFMRNHLDDI